MISRSSPGDHPEQRKEVDQRVGKVALTLVLHHRRRTMPFAQPLLVRTEDQWNVREHRQRGAKRSEEQHMLWRIRDVVIAADDMRDAHVDVVDDN
jgi:hypothetical protein